MITTESSDVMGVTTVSGLAGARGNEFVVSEGEGTGEASSVDATCDGPEPLSVLFGPRFSFRRVEDPRPDSSDIASSTSVECVGEGPAQGTSLRAIREKREGLDALVLYTFALDFLVVTGFSMWVDEDGTFSVDEDLFALRREKWCFELVKVLVESDLLSLSLSFDSSPDNCDSVVGTGVGVLAIVGSGLGSEGSDPGTEVGPCSSMFASLGIDTLTTASSAPDALFSGRETEAEAMVRRI